MVEDGGKGGADYFHLLFLSLFAISNSFFLS
jgi:hypothetical protein